MAYKVPEDDPTTIIECGRRQWRAICIPCQYESKPMLKASANGAAKTHSLGDGHRSRHRPGRRLSAAGRS